MGNAPAVSVQAQFIAANTAVPYLHHMLITGVPEDTTFRTNFQNSTQSWMHLDPDTLQGLVAEMTEDTWESRLKSLGATSSEPMWIAMQAYWNALRVADGDGNRERVVKPDVVYLGRRTSAVVSINTFTFTTNTAGRVVIKVNESRYLYAGSTPAGALAQTTVIADGVLTIGDLADNAAAQLTAIADLAAHFTAVSDGIDTVTVTGLQPGYPLVLGIMSSTPGPDFTQAITTANVGGAYDADLDEMQAAAEFGQLVDPPRRRYYWITDLQGDDVVNAEGAAWVQDQDASFTPKRDYQFRMWSTSGARPITIGGNLVGNFDPTSTDSAAAEAQAANAGEGWSRAGVWDHDRMEFLTVALAGRCDGYLPGEVYYMAKVLQGGAAAARMSPRDFGDDESLSLKDERAFNFYSADGPGLDGMTKWGYLANGKWSDDQWAEDYIEYQVRVDLLQWMVFSNIITYTNATLKAGEGIIAQALAKIPAVIKESIGVVSLERSQVNPADIVARIYLDYTARGVGAGAINRFGTPGSPIPITIQTNG